MWISFFELSKQTLRLFGFLWGLHIRNCKDERIVMAIPGRRGSSYEGIDRSRNGILRGDDLCLYRYDSFFQLPDSLDGWNGLLPENVEKILVQLNNGFYVTQDRLG